MHGRFRRGNGTEGDRRYGSSLRGQAVAGWHRVRWEGLGAPHSLEIEMATLADQLEQMRSGLPSSEDSGGSRLTEQLEQMRIRMNDVARREHEMAAELDAAVRG